MKKIAIIIGIVFTLTFVGCGYKEGVRTEATKAHFYFTGNTQGVVVSVDGGERFHIESGRDNLYNIAPGKHTVEVYRGDTLIVKREIFVSDGVAKEIEVH